ncbi:MAG: DHH family phosphoesterase [Candidatus Moranbacteria bacterium]|nr:DHH family phosphoesterase [Candidatus Moranbacteria bacterium]
MNPIVVTTGQAFADIDTLACAIAYTELLQVQGKPAETVLPGALNSSVTDSIKSWGLDYLTSPTHQDTEYVLVDISDPAHFATCTKFGTVTEIYDHHSGYEAYWQEKIGTNAHIEPIGACATLIWEEWKSRGQAQHISQKSAQLLAVAILSNTLNFGAIITHERDRVAYTELQARFPFSDEWIASYFSEQEEAILKNVRQSIINDTKVITLPSVHFTITVGQLELWDGSMFLKENTEAIESALVSFGHDHWIMSIPSLSEKKNHFYTKNKDLKALFSRILGITFDGDFATSPRLWLRKEIIKQLS